MDIRLRDCTVCGGEVVSLRTPGRPRSLCSTRCRVVAQRNYRRQYLLRQASALAA